jgi:hypothetical protein
VAGTNNGLYKVDADFILIYLIKALLHKFWPAHPLAMGNAFLLLL